MIEILCENSSERFNEAELVAEKGNEKSNIFMGKARRVF